MSVFSGRTCSRAQSKSLYYSTSPSLQNLPVEGQNKILTFIGGVSAAFILISKLPTQKHVTRCVVTCSLNRARPGLSKSVPRTVCLLTTYGS
jgi:hypothetical protein